MRTFAQPCKPQLLYCLLERKIMKNEYRGVRPGRPKTLRGPPSQKLVLVGCDSGHGHGIQHIKQ
eukprot:1154445-Amorphochlora_amoeboformis.AAC.1